MIFLILLICSCFVGFLLFTRVRLTDDKSPVDKDCKVSIIIPARDEENNLPNLLESLKAQTYQPHEIIVIDDFSTDRTYETAKSYGVKVIKNTKLPENWTGKNWALRNGFKEATGNMLVFLDADVRLAPGALEVLLKTRAKVDGAISVVPFHHTNKFYERLSLVLYLLSNFTFTSSFERKSKIKGMYGPCIVVTREDYEKINGHTGIKSELLDDLNLGKRLSESGVKVMNFIGYKFVSFRMYPNGLRSEFEGYGKGALNGAATLRPVTIAAIAVWLIGLAAAGFITPVLILRGSIYTIPFVIGYFLYSLQMIYFLKYSGNYGWYMPFIHPVATVFLIVVLVYSAYRIAFHGSVTWKGRQVRV